MSFDGRTFRNSLGAFATGVAVVTAVTASAERLGLTISSFNSVSIDPPLILFSIGRRNRGYPAWTQITRYAINVLSQEQEALSNRFARPLADKWLDTPVIDGDTGVPLLANALASFECEAYARYEGGDHDIFIGRVQALRVVAHKTQEPLIFFGGGYRRLDTGFRDLPPRDAYLFEGW